MSRQSIQNVVATRIFNLGLVPSTVLVGSVLAGATQVTVAATKDGNDNPLFVKYGLLTFWDGGGSPDLTMGAEETLAIADVDYTGNVITLDFTGVGYSGLQHAHSNGATVGTNLAPYWPNDTAPSLAGTHPFIWAMAYKDQVYSKYLGPGGRDHVYSIWLMYERLTQVPSKSRGLNTNVFANRQQQLATGDIETMQNYFIANPEFPINGSPNARKMGPEGSRDWFQVDWTRMQIDKETWRIAVPMTLVLVVGSNISA